VTGPGLLGANSVALNRAKRTFSVALACQGNGTVSVTARSVTKGSIAKGSYRCAANRSTARLKVSEKVSKRIVSRKTVPATATVKQGGKSTKLAFTLRVGNPLPARSFWTDGHLQCTDGSGAAQAYLVEPDFTTATQTPVSTRGWVAWYTAGGGWHWLGVNGENANRWDTLTATVGGIAQFHPNGSPTPVPWTWGPIAVPTGQGIYTVGVYEIVYWVGGHPRLPVAVRQRGDHRGRGGRRRQAVLRRLLSSRAPHQQVWRQASRAKRLRMAMKPPALACWQKALVASSYSATKTALPAFTNGRRRSHSWYWKHCSLSAQSKSGSSATA
jgi:hypothetical protein